MTAGHHHPSESGTNASASALASGPTAAPALSARGIDVSLGRRPVLCSIDLDLPRGRWTSVVGPNGAGKSTLLKALGGLVPVSAGRLELLGRDVSLMPSRLRGRQLAWLGQNESSNDAAADDLSVYDVVMLGRMPHRRWLAPADAADHAAVAWALTTTRAWDWRERPSGQLSGGERQRVLLARVLAVQADVILMDEPVANLDPPHQADWLATVRQLVAGGTTVISVLHELNLALQADQLVIVADGRIVHHGDTEDAASHRAIERVFEHRVLVRSDPPRRPYSVLRN